MFNEVVTVVVSAFQKEGRLADKNGMTNVWLTPVAGKIPNTAMVVAGTVAEKAGLSIGKTLMVMINEGEPREVEGLGTLRSFNHTVLGEVKPSEILGLRKELGTPFVLDTRGGVEADVTNNPANTANAGATPVIPADLLNEEN